MVTLSENGEIYSAARVRERENICFDDDESVEFHNSLSSHSQKVIVIVPGCIESWGLGCADFVAANCYIRCRR